MKIEKITKEEREKMMIKVGNLYTKEEREKILEKYPCGEFDFKYVGFGIYELIACRLWEHGEIVD